MSQGRHTVARRGDEAFAMPDRFEALSKGFSRWANVDGDTWAVASLPEAASIDVDARDPRTRSFGNIQPGNMEVDRQRQEFLAASASMRAALLAYSGITVKMMVDTDLGALLSTMFMVRYEPGGFAGAHDHPFEETYLILEGEPIAASALARDPGAATAGAALIRVRQGWELSDGSYERTAAWLTMDPSLSSAGLRRSGSGLPSATPTAVRAWW